MNHQENETNTGVRVEITSGTYIICSLLLREFNNYSFLLALLPRAMIADLRSLLEETLTQCRILLPHENITYVNGVLEAEKDSVIVLSSLFNTLNEDPVAKSAKASLIKSVSEYIRLRPNWVALITGVTAESLANVVQKALTAVTCLPRDGITMEELLRDLSTDVTVYSNELVVVKASEWRELVKQSDSPVTFIQQVLQVPVIGKPLGKWLTKTFGIRKNDMKNLANALISMVDEKEDGSLDSVRDFPIGHEFIRQLNGIKPSPARVILKALNRLKARGKSVIAYIGPWNWFSDVMERTSEA